MPILNLAYFDKKRKKKRKENTHEDMIEDLNAGLL